MVLANETCFMSLQRNPGKHGVLYDLPHECLEICRQIGPFFGFEIVKLYDYQQQIY